MGSSKLVQKEPVSGAAERIMCVSTFKGIIIHPMINPAHQAGDKAQTQGKSQ